VFTLYFWQVPSCSAQNHMIKLLLNITFAQVWTGKHLSDTIPIHNGPKKGGAATLTFPNFSSE
jgi:hypothetical protein